MKTANVTIAEQLVNLMGSEKAKLSAISTTTGVKRRRLIRILEADGRFTHEGPLWFVKEPVAPVPAVVEPATLKFYKYRDSATTVLRNLGISAAVYNDFITPVEGGVHLNVTAARSAVAAK
jgi:hypothetical protein